MTLTVPVSSSMLVIIYCLALHLRFSKLGWSRAGQKFSPNYFSLIFCLQCSPQKGGANSGKDQKNPVMRGREMLTAVYPSSPSDHRLSQVRSMAHVYGDVFSSKTPRPLFSSVTPFTFTNASCHLSSKHDAHGQTHLHILLHYMEQIR